MGVGGGTNLIPDFAFETKEEDSISQPQRWRAASRIDLNFHHFLVTAADPDDE
jgi:hypothetical protein